eukprot:TRINITY_DN4797_c0_g1_i1.p1 TRINITY_DN4797_c0_g1~~TRINITY_DN4797_c0_g1_i1.p1  ORF type:complete len:125 (+),score=30.86 TRINITY_DN4797_c0_g1_i1:172-546(+)
MLQQQYPDLEVEGRNAMPPPWKQHLSQAVTIAMWTGLALMFMGDSIFQQLNIPPPELYLQAKENQMIVVMSLWFMGSTISQNLWKTGAFEISLDGELVWSKLATDRLPTWPELVNVLNGDGGMF